MVCWLRQLDGEVSKRGRTPREWAAAEEATEPQAQREASGCLGERWSVADGPAVHEHDRSH